MTGFSSWCRRVLNLGPPRDQWVAAEADAKDDCVPARLKLCIRNRQQFEIKIVYQLNHSLDRQQYRMEVFIFFPKELESHDMGFYHNLWSTVRLHSPKVLISDMRWLSPGTQLGQLAAAIRELETALAQQAAGGPAADPQVSALTQLLRLHCSCVRRSLRHAAKTALHRLQRAAGSKQGASALAAAGADVTQLVQHLMEAIEALQVVCHACSAEGMPLVIAETWSLSFEFLLCEAERCLMKLLLGIQGGLQPGRAGRAEADRSIDVNLSPRELETLPAAAKAEGPAHQELPVKQLGNSYAEPQTALSLKAAVETKAGPTNGQLLKTDHDVMESPLATAQAVLSEAIDGLQDARKKYGFAESIMQASDALDNEKYTNRVKVLKRHSQAANTLTPQNQRPSFLLPDLVGMAVAAVAMAVAVFSVYAATYWSGSQYGALYLAIIIGAYVIKDRLKEWGKRYLQPVAEWFGLEFPDAITNYADSQGKKVGEAHQFCSVKEDTAVDKRVLEMRWKDSWIPTQRHAAKPEKVLVYRKRVTVFWGAVSRQLRAVTGLDDVMRVDVHHFCRRMAPPREDHYRLTRDRDGSAHVERVACARVYHLNLVVRIRSVRSAGEGRAGQAASKLMRMERARLVVDKDGILRLEQLGMTPLEKPLPKASATAALRRLSVVSLQKPR